MRGRAVAELNGIKARFDAAKRTVNLLAGAARLVAIPDIPNLPLTLSLSTADYAVLRASCPGLRLPPIDATIIGAAPGIRQLESLRQAVQGAVQDAIDKAERTPLGLISQLEASVSGEIDTVLAKLAPLDGILSCACSAASVVFDSSASQGSDIWDSLKTKREDWTVTPPELKSAVSSLRSAKSQLAAVASLPAA